MSRISLLAMVGCLLFSTGPSVWAQATGGAGAGGAAGGTQAGTGGQAGAGQAGAGQAGAAAQPGAGQAGTGTGIQGAQPGVGGNAAGINPNTTGVNPNFSGINSRPWFSDPGVRQQLQLNNQQFNRLNDIYGTQYNQYRQEMQRLRGMNLSPSQLNARERALQQQFRQGFQQNFDDAFRDAPFRDRFGQLDRQFQGYNAFQNPEISQRLNLTQAQTERIQRLSQQWNTEMQQLLQDARTNPNQYTERLRSMQAAMARQLRPVLSPDQYREWQQMTGDPYQFSADVFSSEEDQIR